MSHNNTQFKPFKQEQVGVKGNLYEPDLQQNNRPYLVWQQKHKQIWLLRWQEQIGTICVTSGMAQLEIPIRFV